MNGKGKAGVSVNVSSGLQYLTLIGSVVYIFIRGGILFGQRRAMAQDAVHHVVALMHILILIYR
jgi:hypothetical protein